MLLVSWLPPLEPNGVLLSYTVYCKVLAAGSGDFSGGSSESGNFLSPMPVHSMAVSSSTTQLRFSGLMPYTAYECYVTGTTSAGEGNYTTVSTASTDEAGKLCLLLENIIFGSCYYVLRCYFCIAYTLTLKSKVLVDTYAIFYTITVQSSIIKYTYSIPLQNLEILQQTLWQLSRLLHQFSLRGLSPSSQMVCLYRTTSHTIWQAFPQA